MNKRKSMLIVDDEEVNRFILRQLFEGRYDVLEANNGVQALDIIEEKQDSILMVLLDITMPQLDGFGVIEHMKQRGLASKIPVILITGDNSADSAKRGYEYGTADIINKPFDPSVVSRRVENIIDLYEHKNHLEELVEAQTTKIEEQSRRLKDNDNFLIDTLSTVVEFRNMESGQHITRIQHFTQVLLRYVMQNEYSLKLMPEHVDMIASASALHDIGKIAIPDAILLKPGKLTTEEFDVMKTHTIKGCEILNNMTYIHDKAYFQYSYEIARGHHERWDGRGYPDGLKGDEIPLSAQVVSMADVYDALVSERVYKPAFPSEKAVQMIMNGECGAFNPKLLDCFSMAKDEMADLDNTIATAATNRKMPAPVVTMAP